jgi:uncharacterized lipoprotein YmbA
MCRWIFLLVSGLALAACSTTITTHQPMPAEMVGNLQVTAIRVASNVEVPTTIGDRLKAAVEQELAKRSSGHTPVTLNLQINEYRVSNQGTRAVIGAIAGSNFVAVAVEVRDGADQLRASFDVRRESNPGGYGAFYNQEAAMLTATAEGIVAALSGGRAPASSDPPQ